MNHPAQTFKQLLREMRPKLHRYCARMAGSAVDGEDIVQDALMKAFVARASFAVLDNPEPGCCGSRTTQRSTSYGDARAGP